VSWPGFTVNIRYRGLDVIPFTTSLKFDIEMWHWAREATINFAPITFWYVLPGGKSNTSPDTTGIKAPVAIKRSDIISPEIKEEKIEGESMVFESVSGGKFRYQESAELGWSNHIQALWNNGKKGDHLNLSFISPDTTATNVKAGLTFSPDYGIFRIYFNGKKLPGAYNLYNKTVTVKEVNLGRQQLKKGNNLLMIEILNPGSINGNTFFGLDYLSFSK
jgi:hypothetical protein